MRTFLAIVLYAAAWTAGTAPTACFAGLVGEPLVISGGGCRFPDVAYNSASGDYLVVWADYTKGARGIFGRRIDGKGIVAGEVFRISNAAEAEALFPAVAYNATNNEYLVTFDSSRSICGQRIRASDGALLGGNFAIGSAAGAIRSAVAWSSASNCYLVTYYAPGGGRTEIFAQRVDHRGNLLSSEMNISRDASYSGYPAVAYGSAGDQFLVAWDHEPKDNLGHIRGQRVSAATGRLLGPVIDIATGGTENRSTIAYDSLRQRWLVQYNESSTPGLSYNQSGRFVNAAGNLGSAVSIARTAAFEGDTLFGGDLAFVPGFGGRFFSSFQCEAKMAAMGGQELLADGQPCGKQLNLGTGPFTSLNNAADTRQSRFLTVWEGLQGKEHYIYARLYEAEHHLDKESSAVQTHSVPARFHRRCFRRK